MQKLGGEGLILSVGSRLVSGKYPEPEEPWEEPIDDNKKDGGLSILP